MYPSTLGIERDWVDLINLFEKPGYTLILWYKWIKLISWSNYWLKFGFLYQFV